MGRPLKYVRGRETTIYSLQDKDFGCVIGRLRITIQPSPSSLAKIFILKPITT